MSDTSPDTTHGRNIKELVIRWLAGQPFTNVLLATGFGAFCWVFYHLITVTIPVVYDRQEQFLKQMTDQHREERTEMSTRHQAEREQTLRTYDKWLNRSAGSTFQAPDVAGGISSRGN